jgi:hypothetical protein
MKAVIRDVGLLRAVRPEDLRTYLESRGWTEGAAVSKFGSLWLLNRPGKRAFEALVPNTDVIDDYPARVSDLISLLEVAEERSQIEIVGDLMNSLSDVIRVRAASTDTEDGTIALDDGVRLVRSAREMMLSAASSAADPKPLYTSRRPEQAAAFVQHSRMGQSERGSYVITILSPIQPSKNREIIPGLHDPFERAVTRTLAVALEHIQEGAKRALSNGDLKVLTESVQHGVSANLCDAIVEMSGPKRQAIEVGFSWSPAVQIPEGATRRIEIKPEYISIIEEAGKRLRDTAPQEDFSLVGVVIGLHRAEGDIFGRVTILGFVDGRPRRVSLELGPPAYSEAGRAHISRTPVTCVGNLVKLGRAYVLKAIKSFDVPSPDSEPED